MSNPLIESMREAEVIDSVSIALPSLGRFYEEGVLNPDADPADIEVRAVGIMAEMHARDPFLLAAGKGIAALVLQICPAVVDPEALSEIDIEAILIASRVVSHGKDMVITHKCSNPKTDDDGKMVCDQEDNVNLDLQEFIMRYEPFELDDKFSVDIPELNQKVHLKPIEYNEATKIVKDTMFNMRNYEKFENMRVDDFLGSEKDVEEYTSLINKAAFTNVMGIVSGIHYVEYNGGKTYDVDNIKEWLTSIHRDFVKRISIKQEELAMFLRKNTEIKYKCSKCGFENNTYLELDPQKIFFSEAVDSNPQQTPSHTSKKSVSQKITSSRTSQR